MEGIDISEEAVLRDKVNGGSGSLNTTGTAKPPLRTATIQEAGARDVQLTRPQS